MTHKDTMPTTLNNYVILKRFICKNTDSHKYKGCTHTVSALQRIVLLSYHFNLVPQTQYNPSYFQFEFNFIAVLQCVIFVGCNVAHTRPEKVYFSRQGSQISHYFLCISLSQKSKFPSKWLNFPAMTLPKCPFFPTMCGSTNAVEYTDLCSAELKTILIIKTLYLKPQNPTINMGAPMI